MTTLSFEIPDDVIRALNLPPGEVEGELRKELAVALYARGALSVGKAAEFAGLNPWDFEKILGERRVPRHYGEEELDEDLAYARGDS